MRPGCKMLARVSFLAANFLSRDWHFPPHSRPGRLCFQGWALAPGYPETHTHSARLSLAALITLLLLDVASGIPEVIPKQQPFWCNEKQFRLSRWGPGSITSWAHGCRRLLYKLPGKVIPGTGLEPVSGTRHLPSSSLVLAPFASHLLQSSEDPPTWTRPDTGFICLELS